jgi:cytochrome c556
MKQVVLKSKWIGLIVSCIVLPGVAWSLPAAMAPDKAIKARQSGYFLMGQQMARINATIKGDVPLDKDELQKSAELLELLSRMTPDNFPAGSEQGTTKAKPEIWKDSAHFKQLADAMTVEAGKLKGAVASGNLSLMKVAYGNASRSCKACHDSFKAQ